MNHAVADATSISPGPVGTAVASTGDVGDDGGSDEPHGHLTIRVALAVRSLRRGMVADLRRWIAQVARHLQITEGELSIALVGDDQMTELHRQYRNEDGTTDVLTFDMRDDPGDPLDGELVICVDEARRQALAHSHDPTHEILLYAVHGLLHMLGYDDHDPADAKAMHAREDELLEAIGVGAVYHRPRPLAGGDGV